jgi:hypothetical protein
MHSLGSCQENYKLGAGQVTYVVECMPSKWEYLSPNSSTKKKKQKTKP